jgi:hypothetical protein
MSQEASAFSRCFLAPSKHPDNCSILFKGYIRRDDFNDPSHCVCLVFKYPTSHSSCFSSAPHFVNVIVSISKKEESQP